MGVVGRCRGCRRGRVLERVRACWPRALLLPLTAPPLLAVCVARAGVGVGCGGGFGGVCYMHVWVYACMQRARVRREPWVHTRCSPGCAARTPPSSPSPCTRGACGGCPVPRHTRGVAEASQRGGCEARERGVNPGTHAVLPGLCGARGFSPPPSFPLPTLLCLLPSPLAVGAGGGGCERVLVVPRKRRRNVRKECSGCRIRVVGVRAVVYRWRVRVCVRACAGGACVTTTATSANRPPLASACGCAVRDAGGQPQHWVCWSRSKR